MDAFIGQIILWAGTQYVPDGWLPCEGQSISVREEQALFSIIGSTYGGDGTSYFLLPDLRGRVAVGAGQHAGGSQYSMGNTGGNESEALTTKQLPAHSHQAKLPNNANGLLPALTGNLPVTTNLADKQIPGPDAVPAALPDAGGNLGPNTCIYGSPDGSTSIPVSIPQGGIVNIDFSRSTAAISETGENEAHNNMQPYLALRYIICTRGEYPPQPRQANYHITDNNSLQDTSTT